MNEKIIESMLASLKNLSESVEALMENQKIMEQTMKQIEETQIQMLENELDRQMAIGKPKEMYYDIDLKEKSI